MFYKGVSPYMQKVIVTAAFIYNNGKLLIAQRKRGSHLEFKWELPGGKLEANESEKECLKRELKEELNIDCKVGDLYHINEHSYNQEKVIILKTYKVYFSGDIVTYNSHEDSTWISPQDADLYDFAPADIPVINKIKNEYTKQ